MTGKGLRFLAAFEITEGLEMTIDRLSEMTEGVKISRYARNDSDARNDRGA